MKRPHRCFLPSLGGVWKVLGGGVNLILSQTWKEFWPETRNKEDDAGMECLQGRLCQDNFVQWKLTLVLPCLRCLRSPHPSANTTMPQWHDWYEENCGFCLKPGHMQKIKNSSFQNLQRVNELLIQVSSLRMQLLHLPTAMVEQLFNSKATYTVHPSNLVLLFPATKAVQQHRFRKCDWPSLCS